MKAIVESEVAGIPGHVGWHGLASFVAGMFAGRWWESRWAICAALILSTVPLLLPAFPPLIDVPGHIGRYHIAAAIAHSADLQRHWTFRWALIGNLGVDLLVVPLQPVFGSILAAKLVILTIPPLFLAGLILLSRACDGRQSPALAFAFPLAYSFPFQFGFVNFMLSVALALIALALWIRLGKERRLRLRAGVFVPISIGLWLAHSFGWGAFGLFAFASEWQRLHRLGKGSLAALIGAGLSCVSLALPFLALIAAAGGGHGLGIGYNWHLKIFWAITVLRERWLNYDMACTAMLFVLPLAALRPRGVFRLEPTLALLALIALATFLALPRLMLGGFYVDARMIGIALALALAAIRLRDQGRQERIVAGVASAFFMMRMATSTIALSGFAHGETRALEVVDRIPRGAAVLVIVKEPCGTAWHTDRLEHVDGIAIVRRDIYDNAQWTIPGQQLLSARGPSADSYRADPSQLSSPPYCEHKTTVLRDAVRTFDRATFDYVWTMDFPSRSALAPDVRRVWSNQVSTLYRVDHPGH